MSQLTVIANIIAKTESIELVKAELIKLLAVTRAEEGCINYDLHQDNQAPEHFTLYENWVSRELWQAHMANDQLAEYVKATEGAITTFTLNEMTQIS
ncbi:putative quinol monooxygenase [Marinomonas pollencensis]|uniref:Quinol monooxygenase YgiN n=1 Tax=Marinomonas pollencensis TaxID=491954 RepID=A0A3E0DC49_9GAMM|nr:putative quinol monooxygenase [Marinomonas pollencensis]REG79552.1 quinol monooxygenase YgiN [Marinomonas pollencensis]